jgi:COMPASS component BRE2
MGTPFKDLYAFLPPASRATNGTNNLGVGERENADDGMIGYYPMVSCHNGGAVECRFGAPWWVGPPVNDVPDVKPFGERYDDQIAEDIVADIVDEIEAMFAGWGGVAASTQTNGRPAAVAVPPAIQVALGPDVQMADGTGSVAITEETGGASGGASIAPTVIDDGTSINASTPQYGSAAGEIVTTEDHEMEL